MTTRISPFIPESFPAQITLSDWFVRIAPYVSSAEMATIPGEIAALYSADRRSYRTVWAECLCWRVSYGQTLEVALAALWKQTERGAER